ncbi:MAG: hypothetical protein NTX82_06895 [Candidatus Parcubacteria bacterium]|nr:hypothetical protein [Candidatus Parcubacteria bacterium]
MQKRKKSKQIKKLQKDLRVVIKLLVLAVVITLAHQSIAGMSSDNYQIWIDTFDAGGGLTNSTGFKVDSNLSEFTAGRSESANFGQRTAFSGIEGEPTVGFSVQSVNLDFGELSPKITRYATHIFSAYTNAKEGYTIKVYGQSLHSADYTIEPIGTTAASISIGAEQFGLNLVRNTLPALGANPSGGIGLAAPNYNQVNKFAFHEGDTIAYAESYSYQTNFTVTAIVNIADDTPAGAYETVLTYEFIPIF